MCTPLSWIPPAHIHVGCEEKALVICEGLELSSKPSSGTFFLSKCDDLGETATQNGSESSADYLPANPWKIWTCDLSYIDFTLWTFTKCGRVDGNKIFMSGSCSLSILTRSKTNWELSTSSRRDITKRLSFTWHRWAWSKAWQVLQGREVRSRKTKPRIQTKEITLGFLCYLKTPCYFLWWILLLEVAPPFFPFFTRFYRQPNQQILQKHFYFLPENGQV